MGVPRRRSWRALAGSLGIRELAHPGGVLLLELVGETAPSCAGGSEVDADVVQVQAPPDISSVVHLAPPLSNLTGTVLWFPPSCLAKASPPIGKIGDIQPTYLPTTGNVLVVGISDRRQIVINEHRGGGAQTTSFDSGRLATLPMPTNDASMATHATLPGWTIGWQWWPVRRPLTQTHHRAAR
jgi:hypothetical protein